MKSCGKYNCPNRLVFGRESDEDSISYVCSNCNELYYYSEKRSSIYRKRIRTIFLIGFSASIIFLMFYYGVTSESSTSTSSNGSAKSSNPIELTQTFFTLLNEEKMEEAYQLTDNPMWSPFSKFVGNGGWGNFSDLKLLDHQEKSYPSRFESDAIYEITFKSKIPPEDSVVRKSYDFHYKRYNNGWKIIRMIYAKPKNFYSPSISPDDMYTSIGASGTVRQFFNYLDAGKFDKAHYLTYNYGWGNYEKFKSIDNGWGGITNVTTLNIKEVGIESEFGDKVFYCKYYAEDPYNESGTYEFLFHLKQIEGEWKIVKATIPEDE